MKTMYSSKQVIWYDEILLDDQIQVNQCCNIDYWQQQDKVIGSAQGRGTTWFVALDNIEAALRHYRRGGLFGKLVKDHYIFTGWEKTRSYQEFILLNRLIEAGVHVPKPIVAKAKKRTLCYQADLLSEKIPNAQDLISLLQKESLSKELYKKIGVEIRKMHNTQVNHTDLNIHNILIDKNEKVWVIDFDKCYQQQGDKWKEGNLSRLKRSFYKEVKKRNIYWLESEWKYILAGYRC